MPLDIFQTCWGFLSRADVEGGLVDNPNDPGGLTNTGLTMADMRQFSRSATENDLRALTAVKKQAIYLALYFLPVAGWDLPPAASLLVFDHGVNAGVGDSAMLLQRELHVDDDGQIGKFTLRAMDAVGPANLRALLGRVRDAQAKDYAGKANARFFIKGWNNRLAARWALAQTLLPT